MEGKKITKLEVQKNNNQRINVFLNDVFAFGLSRDTAAWLNVGQILSDEQINNLLSKERDNVIFAKAINYISIRPRSEYEIRQKLSQNGYEAQRIEKVISRLKDSNLLNDENFSAQWIENRNTFRPRSKRMMAAELRKKKVPENVIQHSLQNSDDLQTAFELAEKYKRKLINCDWKTFRNKLGGYLARKGYDFETINQVTRQIWEVEKKNDAENGES